ncbi:uncharacterized protein [Onthophagus taurus]|uniref:uncharacterized protein n=1 Tax=Onthophagus taurus TaxID=166361 RepID=UPI0039BE10CA
MVKEMRSELRSENLQLRDRVSDLTAQVHDMEQYSRRNNLEIQGVPEKNNENLLDAVAAHVGYDISRVDVDAIYRVPHINPENLQLRDRVSDLTAQVHDMEQYSRRNNLEIQGVPEKNNENLLDAVAAHVGYDISRVDVDAVYRVPHINRHNSNPRSIAVPRSKDQWIIT